MACDCDPWISQSTSAVSLQGTPDKILEELVSGTIDETFAKDFLLTYRTFLTSPMPIVEKLKEAWEGGFPAQREKVRWEGGRGGE